jgi:hypothetical protein
MSDSRDILAKEIIDRIRVTLNDLPKYNLKSCLVYNWSALKRSDLSIEIELEDKTTLKLEIQVPRSTEDA